MSTMSNELAVFGPFRAKTCEWSIGDGLGAFVNGKTVCCGKPVVPNKPYCEEHMLRAYYKPDNFDDIECFLDKDLEWMIPSDIDVIYEDL